MRPLSALVAAVAIVALIGTYSFAYSCTTGTVTVTCATDDGDTIVSAEATVTPRENRTTVLTRSHAAVRTGLTVGKAMARTIALIAVSVAKTAVYLAR